MFEVIGRLLSPDALASLGDLAPRRVLFEFDGIPRIFTASTPYGAMLLAYQCAEDDDHDGLQRFLVVPFSPPQLDELTTGVMTVREALTQPWLWLVDILVEGDSRVIKSFWHVDASSLFEDSFPDPEVMLWPTLDPLLRVRAKGPDAEKGNLKPQVIQQVALKGENALKKVSTFVANKLEVKGRLLNRLKDSRAQHVGFRSFEIGFRPAKDTQAAPLDAAEKEEEAREESAAIDRVGSLIARGLVWASQGEGDFNANEAFADKEEREIVLEAIEGLTPAPGSGITEIEVGGRMVASKLNSEGEPVRSSVILTEQSRERLKGVLKPAPVKADGVRRLTGRLAVSDKEKYQFILRGMSEMDGELRCKYPKELHSLVMDAYRQDNKVRVTGVLKPRSFTVSNLEILKTK